MRIIADIFAVTGSKKCPKFNSNFHFPAHHMQKLEPTRYELHTPCDGFRIFENWVIKAGWTKLMIFATLEFLSSAAIGH